MDIKREMKEEVKLWVNRAKDDLKKAKDNFNINHYDLSSFLCQQAVEKALKAFLIEKSNKFPKIHDLVRLGRLVGLPQNLINGVKELTLAYVYTRYPDVTQASDLELKTSNFLKLSERILKWIEKRL